MKWGVRLKLLGWRAGRFLLDVNPRGQFSSLCSVLKVVSHGIPEWFCRGRACELLWVWIIMARMLCLPMKGWVCDEWDLHECVPAKPRAQSLGLKRPEPLGWQQHGWGHSMDRA